MSDTAQISVGGRSVAENEGMALSGRHNATSMDSNKDGAGTLIGNPSIPGSQLSLGSQASRESGAELSRSYKDMVESVKKLHKQADNLEEKICHVYGQFADLTLKASSLFDPEVVQILTDEYKEIGGIDDPEEVHFTRQSVNDAYIELSQILSEREGVEIAS